jgi:hypothetical protein
MSYSWATLDFLFLFADFFVLLLFLKAKNFFILSRQFSFAVVLPDAFLNIHLFDFDDISDNCMYAAAHQLTKLLTICKM